MPLLAFVVQYLLRFQVRQNFFEVVVAKALAIHKWQLKSRTAYVIDQN